MTIKIPEEIFEEWNQKIEAIISTMPVMMSPTMAKLCPTHIIEEMSDIEQIKMVLKLDLQCTGQENNCNNWNWLKF